MGGLFESMSVNHVHAVFKSEARQRCWIWISYDAENFKPHMGSGNSTSILWKSNQCP